jgi:hypothetical protein
MSAAPFDRPAVTDLEAIADIAWFAANPRREYRFYAAVGGGWRIVRQNRGVFLRTWLAALPPHRLVDSDAAIEPIWHTAAAWPDVLP